MSPPSAASRLRFVPIALAQGVGVACGVAGVKLNSALIPPDVFGLYGVFLSFAPIGMWVVHAGLVKYMARQWAAAPSRPALARSMIRAWARRLPWLVGLAAGGAALLATAPEARFLSIWFALAASAALLAFAAMGQAALQAEAAHWRDCGVTVGGSLSRTFGPPLLFVGLGGAIDALWLGFAAHAAINALLAAGANGRGFFGNDARAAAGAMPPAYEGPLFVGLAAAAWILAGLNRWIVAWFYGEAEAGYFALVGGAAVVLASTIGAVFVQYFQPGIFGLGDAGRTQDLARRVDRVALSYTFVAFVAVLLFAVCAPLLVGWLIHPRYESGLGWALPAGCFVIATTTGYFYHALLLAGRREEACGPVDLTAAGVLVVGGIVSAAAGLVWFQRWLMLTPLLPWLVNRPMARRALLRPDATGARGPGR